MSEKWCPAGKIECENYYQVLPGFYPAYPKRCALDNSICLEIISQCPFPDRQQPVATEIATLKPGELCPERNDCTWDCKACERMVDRQQPVVKDIAQEIAEMPDEEFKKNCADLRKMCAKNPFELKLSEEEKRGQNTGLLIGYNSALDDAVGAVKPYAAKAMRSCKYETVILYDQIISAINALRK